MSQSNRTTLTSYDAHVQEYIDGTNKEVSKDIKSWIDESLSGLTSNARIFEIGSAVGRDADYVESKGYTVQRSDASKGFVEFMRSQGNDARLFNALTDGFPARYDLIFADAVLLHMTRDETMSVAAKVYKSLLPAGKFVLSLKRGEGEEWSEHKLGAPRFFCYWQAEGIRGVLETAGFTTISIMDSADKKNVDWLLVIAQKSANQ